MTQIAAIIVAAGRGSRAGGGLPKQWRPLGHARVIDATLAAFRAGAVARLVVVVHPQDAALAAGLAKDGCIVVSGAETRAGSVMAGLAALEADPPDRVLIHDAARPLVRPALIARVLAALDSHPGAAPAIGVTDALWRGQQGLVSGTQDRTGLWRAQTPQGFHYGAILAAHRRHPGGAADDVEVARAAGLDVAIVPGDEDNLKITGPDDFARAERLMGAVMDIRTGNGFDVHAFGPAPGSGNHVWLCGVKLAHDRALIGHSDADVGMHAVTDAIYGALGQGDIGQHFPPSEARWKGAASHIFLEHACALARAQGFAITHADCTLICESPKIGPHALAMKSEMARIMGLDGERISVKATTSERLGFTGREEGIAALATATLVKGLP